MARYIKGQYCERAELLWLHKANQIVPRVTGDAGLRGDYFPIKETRELEQSAQVVKGTGEEPRRRIRWIRWPIRNGSQPCAPILLPSRPFFRKSQSIGAGLMNPFVSFQTDPVPQ